MLTQTLARLHIGGIKGWKFHEWHLYAAVAIMIGNFILIFHYDCICNFYIYRIF